MKLMLAVAVLVMSVAVPVKVTVYGNTAIATGAWAGKGVDGDGSKIDRHERWTDTWLKGADGKWQCVASQQTEAKK
jgi:ketosteroid isomerase-like protein